MLDDTTARVATCIAATCALALACGRAPRGAEVAVVGESTRVRLEDARPPVTPWFDGARVTLAAARGETLGIQVLHPSGEPVRLVIPGRGVQVAGYAVEAMPVRHPSTALYGGSHGAGTYADVISPVADASPTSNPAYFEIAVAADAPPGALAGELVVGARRYPVALEVARAALPAALAVRVWAYADPRELGSDGAQPNAAERACIATFRRYGVLLSPDLPLAWWPARRELLAGVRDIPTVIRGADDVRGWIAATRDTGQVPFAIPIDEPRTPDQRAKVRKLADEVRAAGGGPTTFRYAVTDAPHPDYADAVDLYISWRAAHLGDRHERWTYNGAPPYAGSFVLDAETPGARTWGVIGWRWNIPVWYVWDALYWHDRHNTKRALDLADPISFDDGDDHGNLDGVLALPPDCRPTLRLAAIRRGLLDRALLERAAHCDDAAAGKLAAELVPRALADAGAAPSWPTDEGAWELAHRQLLDIASACER